MAELFREIRESTEDRSPAGEQTVDAFCGAARIAVQALREGKTQILRELQALYIADRYFDVRDYIVPRLREGYFVVNDRFCLSTFAYGSAYGVDMEEIYSWHASVFGDRWHLSDAVIYDKVSAETAVGRLFGSGKTIDIWGRRGKLQSLVDCYERSIAFLKRKCLFEGIPDVFFHGRRGKERGRDPLPSDGYRRQNLRCLPS